MSETTSLELGYYLVALRRNWLLIMLGGLIGVGLGYLYLEQGGRSVTATTSVDVKVITSEPFNIQRPASDLISAETEVQKATSAPVLAAALADLGGSATATDIRTGMEARLVPDTTVMRISYTADDTETAEAGADALAQAYLDYRGERVAAQVDTIVGQLEDRRQDLREDLVRINTIINRARPGSGQAVQAESDRQLINIELNTLSSQINGFLGLDTTGGDVLRSAATNPTTVTPSRWLVLGTGLLLGLLLGLVAAFARHAADRRVRDPGDVRRAGGGEVLARLHGSRAGIPAPVADMNELRVARELLFGTLAKERLVVVIADLTEHRAATGVAANFARVVAETGRPVELVMADAVPEVVEDTADALSLAPAASRSTERAFVGAEGSSGIKLVAPVEGALTVTAGDPAVDGRTDGSTTGRGTDPLVTLIAVPADRAHASLLAAGRMADAVLLVASAGETTRSTISQTVKELAVVGGRVHGSVLVKRGRRGSRAST